MGICFVNRWLSKTTEDESMHSIAEDGQRARILILTESMKGNHVELDPKAKDYRAVMNCAFSAEKMNVLIDCFDVTPWSPTLSLSQMSKMQQVCYISKGLHWSSAMDKMEKKELGQDEKDNNRDSITSYFLPTLIFYFLPGRESRKGLRQPPRASVSLNASCFETGVSVEKGYLCSICLSVTSTKRKSCITCHSIFKRFLVFEATKKAKRNVIMRFFPLL